jgi:DNA gyrase/topoisomerase IV subunit A
MLAFPAEDVSELSGPGRGVILLRLSEGDRLLGAIPTPPGQGVLVVKSDGTDREVPLKEIPLGQRAGKGQRVIKRTTLIAVRSVAEEEGGKNGRAS